MLSGTTANGANYWKSANRNRKSQGESDKVTLVLITTCFDANNWNNWSEECQKSVCDISGMKQTPGVVMQQNRSHVLIR